MNLKDTGAGPLRGGSKWGNLPQVQCRGPRPTAFLYTVLSFVGLMQVFFVTGALLNSIDPGPLNHLGVTAPGDDVSTATKGITNATVKYKVIVAVV
jgi:hypothetical protein